MTTIAFEWRVDNVLTDATSVVMSNGGATFGVRRTDTNGVVVAANTPMVRDSVGAYSLEFEEPAAGLTYEYYVKVVYDGETYHIQGFKEGGVGAYPRTFRAAFLDADGEPLELLAPPKLQNPTGTYGAKRLADAVTVIPAGTVMTEIGDGYYSADLEVADPSLKYRFYVRAVIGDRTYYLPSVTNGNAWSVGLVLGRYTDSYLVSLLIGSDNLYLWAGTPQYGTAEMDEPVDFVNRVSQFMRDAEAMLDAELLGAYVLTTPFTDPIPSIISQLATKLTAIAIYESRGIDDVGDNAEGPSHRLSGMKRQVARDLRKVKMGLIPLADSPYGPSVGGVDPGILD